MAKRKNDDMPFGEEYQEIMEQNKRRKELGVDETGERIKTAASAKAKSAKKGAVVKKSKGKSTNKAAARLAALKQFKKTGGMIPASPTR
jgi:hypothetical protein